MSTRSAIIAKTDTGYAGIYCHFDGYEDGVGATLLEHYTDPEKVAALIALGEISALRERVAPTGAHSYEHPEKGVTVAYHRDRGEEQTGPHTGATVEEVAKHIGHNGYVYVFENGAWTCNGQPPVDGAFREAYSSTYGR
jgi:hypothetical protein